MGQRGHFSHDTRVLICAQCGAPLPAPDAGGRVECDGCDASNELRPRVEEPLAPPDRGPIDEDVRMEALRAQDGTPLRPPTTLPLALMTWHGEDDPKKAGRALGVWQQARKRIVAGDPEEHDEDHLYFLSLSLWNYYGKKDRFAQKRAVCETTLELCESPRYRQVLRSQLSRQAAREGDLRAAREWLEPCDDRSEDLHMDSAYRFGRAYLASCEKKWDEVLEWLGREPGDVPIADFARHLVVMHRAHAHEMLGEPAIAKRQLEQALKDLPGSPRQFQDVEEQSAFHLCPETLESVIAPAMRRSQLRHAVFLGVWFCAFFYLVAEWLEVVPAPYSLGLHTIWPAIALVVVGYVINLRLRP